MNNSIAANISTVRYFDGGALPPGQIHVPTASPVVDPGHANGARNRYRVDAAYKSYQRDAATSPPRIDNTRHVKLRRISSVDLLNSMIHQMGGAQTSRAKGSFVDISI